MAWPSAKPELDPPVNIEVYLDEDLVLELDDLGFPLVNDMFLTYRDLEGDETTHRIGDVYVILREEQLGSPPSGLGDVHVKALVRVELQPNA
jgi:hypothetical protein